MVFFMFMVILVILVILVMFMVQEDVQVLNIVMFFLDVVVIDDFLTLLNT